MLDRLRIRNYRVFGDLEITRLGRVNVVAGGNNAGKTSLLEALFLLSGGGNPHFALNASITRTANDIETRSDARITGDSVRETMWKPLFFGFDFDHTIEITGHHQPCGSLSLAVALEPRTNTALPLEDAGRADQGIFDEQLTLRFQQGDRPAIRAAVQLSAQDIHFKHHHEAIPFAASLHSSISRTGREDAILLGTLRKRKQGDVLLKPLQAIEPRLRSIVDNSSSGWPMIWGDVGLPELVPLSVMGEGMTRFASIVLGFVSAQNGLVLIDEVENGIHHSVLTDMWRVIDDSSRRYGVQVFATTHSFECVQAADQAIQTDDLALHRLEVDDGRCRCVTYERSEIAAAIRHDIEVR
jgi:predicted ATPase